MDELHVGEDAAELFLPLSRSPALPPSSSCFILPHASRQFLFVAFGFYELRRVRLYCSFCPEDGQRGGRRDRPETHL